MRWPDCVPILALFQALCNAPRLRGNCKQGANLNCEQGETVSKERGGVSAARLHCSCTAPSSSLTAQQLLRSHGAWQTHAKRLDTMNSFIDTMPNALTQCCCKLPGPLGHGVQLVAAASEQDGLAKPGHVPKIKVALWQVYMRVALNGPMCCAGSDLLYFALPRNTCWRARAMHSYLFMNLNALNALHVRLTSMLRVPSSNLSVVPLA